MIQRINNLQHALDDNHFDSFFISSQANVSYLTGFSGLAPHEREAYLFVTMKNAYLLTFPTYFGLFKNGGSGFTALNITHSKRLKDNLSEIIKKESISNLAFEKADLTVSELESLKSKLTIPFIGSEHLVEQERIIKDKEELDCIKIAAQITDQAFNFILRKMKKGISEKEIALELEFFLKRKSGDIAFSPIVAFNENAAIPHYIPSKDQRLKTNSLILLDFGARYKGYCADMTRVIFFGSPNDSWIKVYKTVLHAQTLALKAIKSGVLGGSIDKIARDYIVSQHYPEYPHGLGHGVGLAIHEAPPPSERWYRYSERKYGRYRRTRYIPRRQLRCKN